MSGNKPVIVALLNLKLINHSRNQKGEQKLMEIFLSHSILTIVVSMFVLYIPLYHVR